MRDAVFGVLVLLVIIQAASAVSTQVHVQKYARDGVTLHAERTVDYRWMEANLPVYGDGIFPATPVDETLISIEYAPGGLIGYTIVVSPAYNQPGWSYPRGGTVHDLLPFKGYWVVMENPDTLYGLYFPAMSMHMSDARPTG